MTALQSTTIERDLETIDALIGDLRTLPFTSLSALVADVVKASDGERAGALDRLERADPRLVLRALQIANTASFGVTRRIRNLPEAAELLGMGPAASFLAVADVFLAFEGLQAARMSMEHFETYSIRVGRLAARFAEPLGLGPQAFMAGALLDVGKLVLATRRPGDFNSAVDFELDRQCPAYVAEQEILGISHPGIGARALELWGFPAEVVDVVAFHHSPSRSRDPVELRAIVHAADALLGIHACGDSESMLDQRFLGDAGFADAVHGWQVLAADEAARALPRTAVRHRD